MAASLSSSAVFGMRLQSKAAAARPAVARASPATVTCKAADTRRSALLAAVTAVPALFAVARNAQAKDPTFRSAGKYVLDDEKCAQKKCKVYPGPAGEEVSGRKCLLYTSKGKEFSYKGEVKTSKNGAFEQVDCEQIIVG